MLESLMNTQFHFQQFFWQWTDLFIKLTDAIKNLHKAFINVIHPTNKRSQNGERQIIII